MLIKCSSISVADRFSYFLEFDACILSISFRWGFVAHCHKMDCEELAFLLNRAAKLI